MRKLKKSILSCVIVFTMILATCVPTMAKVTYETAPTKTVLKGSTFAVTASTSNWNSVLNKSISKLPGLIIEGDVGNASILKYAGTTLKTPCPLYLNYKEKPKAGHFDTILAGYKVDKKTKKLSGPVKLCAEMKALKTGTTYVSFKLVNRTKKTPYVDSSMVVTVPVKVVQGVTSLKLSKTSATLSKGKTLTLKTKVAPSNAYKKKVSYSSSKTSVATVSSTGKITAKGKGTAVITVKALDGSGKKASCKITVR